MGAPRLTVEPGAFATLAFELTNRAAVQRAVQGRLELPSGWQLAIPEPAAVLPPHETELRLLRIALPPQAAAGTYTLSFGVDGTAARDSVLVTVPERRHIATAVRQAPRFVTAGSAYDVVFEIRNVGNAPVVVRLALKGSNAFPVRLDSTAVHLQAGDSRVVSAHVRSDAEITRTVAHRLRLIASVDRDSTRIEPAVSLVEVIPRHAARTSRFRRIPSQLTVRQVDRATRPTVELRGAGALSPDGTVTTDFLFRGPNRIASLFGEQDEYWVALSAPRLRLRLGDRTAPYSRLGESWRPGFGADGEFSFAGLAVGGFTQRDRRSRAATGEEEHGASLVVQPFAPLLAGVRYVTRTGAHAGDVWTAHGLLTPWRATSLDLDVGRGHDTSGTGGAWAVGLSGSFPHGSYALRRLAADSAFPGLTRGTSSNEASATLVPVSRLSISLRATDWTALRTRTLTNPSSNWQRAMDGRVAWGGLLEAGYRQTRETRMVLATRRGRRSESWRLYAGLPLGPAAVRGGIEEGVSTFDDAPAERVPFRRVSVRGNLGRGEDFLAISADWLTGTSTTSWIDDDHLRGSLNAAMPLTPGSRLSVSVSVTSYRGDHPRTPMMLDVGVVTDLPFGQRASWRTRAMSYGLGGPAFRPAHQADYVAPFGLPIGRSRESGAIHVRLIDRESGSPLAGVLVHIGDRVRFTDAGGTVSFDGLAAATHYLEVDRATLGAKRVVVPAPVLGIAVHAGETREVELGVVRGAAVRGSVKRLDAREGATLDAPTTLVDNGMVPGVVLRLSNGTDSLRASVDGWGQFSFGLVPPGSWVLSVIHADLPRHHRFEQERMLLDLQAGDAPVIELRVLPSAPPVQMIAQAEVTLAPSIALASPPRAAMRTPSTRRERYTRRTVPPPAGSDSIDVGLSMTNSPPWRTGRRRYIPAPSTASPALVPPASAPPTTQHRYTVTKWDVSLVQVARVMYDDASLWPKIWLANLDQVPDPDVIRPGQQLRIPDKGPLNFEERRAEERYRTGRHP
jgi:hypothetical protein